MSLNTMKLNNDIVTILLEKIMLKKEYLNVKSNIHLICDLVLRLGLDVAIGVRIE